MTAQGAQQVDLQTKGGDFYMATTGDLNQATSGDFYMATDRLGAPRPTSLPVTIKHTAGRSVVVHRWLSDVLDQDCLRLVRVEVICDPRLSRPPSIEPERRTRDVVEPYADDYPNRSGACVPDNGFPESI